LPVSLGSDEARYVTVETFAVATGRSTTNVGRPTIRRSPCQDVSRARSPLSPVRRGGQGRSHALRLAQEGADIIAFDVCRQLDTVPYPMAVSEELRETANLVENLDRRIVAPR
jgi:hypothetical protein